MKQETHPASLSPAQAYQTLIPALFTEWAPRVADAAGIQTGQCVLDVACGTGFLTREIHHSTGPTGHVTGLGLGLNPDMLAVASSQNNAIEWKKGDAEDLPFPDDYFDAADVLRKPFCLRDDEQLMQLFEQAGIDNLVITQQTGHAHVPDIDTLIDAELVGWMPMNGIAISASQAQNIRQAAKTQLGDYINENGQVRFAMPALIVTGNNTLNH
ncbi:hypothetical protein GCM10023116_27310 [Kistimonas scapharcae]|uniref:Methyltransferase domain-containing protein n=1 Tax=Kistimonas scapharcae TaxID=1036133 RepID=A0ABP8V2J1_9GAMM